RGRRGRGRPQPADGALRGAAGDRRVAGDGRPGPPQRDHLAVGAPVAEVLEELQRARARGLAQQPGGPVVAGDRAHAVDQHRRQCAREVVAGIPRHPTCYRHSGRPAAGRYAPAPMDAAALRDQFPVREDLAYLNAGTDGPVPAAAVAAAREALDAELAGGRIQTHFEARRALMTELREGYARVLGCPPEEVALTSSTSEGIGRV